MEQDEPKGSMMSHNEPKQATTKHSEVRWAKESTVIHNDLVIKNVIMVCSCDKYEINQRYFYFKNDTLFGIEKNIARNAELKKFVFAVMTEYF